MVKLHGQLAKRLPRVRLPDFKPLRAHSSGLFVPASEGLVLKRRQQIATYLRQLLQLAVVADSVEMEAFLAPTDALDAADAPAPSPGGGGAVGGEGGGEMYQQT